MAMAQQQAGPAPARIWRRFASDAAAELRRFELASRVPRDAQRHRLSEILRANADTRFGREHGFATIESIRDYQGRVPVTDWEHVSPWIERIEAGERRVLTADEPMHFERTSGSGAARKDIPYTTALLREFQSALVVWLATLIRDCPAAAGPSYWSLSPDPSGPATTARGATVGSANDAFYLEGCSAAPLLATVIAPKALSAPGASWQVATLQALALESELRLISVWSPTFLLALLEAALDRTHAGASMDTLRETLPGDRFTALSAAIDAGDFTKLWPNLALISCWTDGPSATFAMSLEALFPGVRLAPKGLFATEGVVSLSWGAGPARPIALTSHFLEFVDDDGAAKTIDELAIGRRYRPLLTTSGGLYRYRLGDVVEVTGFLEKTPCIRYVGREDGRSDLVGEKLDEPLVSLALRAAALAGPAILVPFADASPPRYVLITESSDARAANSVETALCRVHHYSIARMNRQLDAVSCCHVGSLSLLLHEAWQAAGRRSGDAKPASLIVSAEHAAAIIATLRARVPVGGFQ